MRREIFVIAVSHFLINFAAILLRKIAKIFIVNPFKIFTSYEF